VAGAGSPASLSMTAAVTMSPAVLGRSTITDVPAPLPLRSTAWIRRWYATSLAIVIPSWFAVIGATADSARRIAAGCFLAGTVLHWIGLMSWSGTNAANVRRLLVHSRYPGRPSGRRAVMWWVLLVVMAFPLALAAGWARTMMDSPDIVGPSGSRTSNDFMIGLGVTTVVAVLALVLYTRPFLYLARATSKVKGDPKTFHRWIWMPFVAAVVGGLLIWATVLSALDDDRVPPAKVGLVILGVALPTLVWHSLGWRSLSYMSVTIEARHDGMTREHLMAQQALTQQQVAAPSS
jgi:hypothetical protein